MLSTLVRVAVGNSWREGVESLHCAPYGRDKTSRMVVISAGTGRLMDRQVRSRGVATLRMGALGGRRWALSHSILARWTVTRAGRQRGRKTGDPRTPHRPRLHLRI